MKLRFVTVVSIAVVGMSSLTAPLQSAQAQARAADSSAVWEHKTRRDITFYALTSLGHVLVSTQAETMALDGATGSIVWTSTELRECKQIDNEFITWPLPVCRLGPLQAAEVYFSDTSELALVQSPDGVAAFNLESGRPSWIWRPTSFKGTPIANIRARANPREFIVLSEVREGRVRVAGVRLDSGEEAWTTDVPFSGGMPVVGVEQIRIMDVNANPLVLVGKGPAERAVLVGLDATSGKILWRQDAVPSTPDSLSYVTTFDDSSTRVVRPGELSKDAQVFALDTSTGSIRWRLNEPFTTSDFCVIGCMLGVDGRIFFLHKDLGVTAVRLSDGSVHWRSPVTGMRGLLMTAQGLLVGCDSERQKCGAAVTLLDPDTGVAKWAEPAKLGAGVSRVDLSNSRIVSATASGLFTTSLDAGRTTALAKFTLRVQESPDEVLVGPDRIVVLSSQNIVGVDREGKILYQRYYAAPRASFFEKFVRELAASGLNAVNAYAAQQWAGQQARQNAGINARAGGPGEGVGTAIYTTYHPKIRDRFTARDITPAYYYVYTDDPDKPSNQRFSLVQIDLKDGVEVGRAPVNERKPDLRLDSFAQVVFSRVDGNRVAALKFSPSLSQR